MVRKISLFMEWSFYSEAQIYATFVQLLLFIWPKGKTKF